MFVASVTVMTLISNTNVKADEQEYMKQWNSTDKVEMKSSGDISRLVLTDGSEYYLSTSAMVIGNITYVPLQSIFQVLGYTIDLESKNGVALFSNGVFEFEFEFDSQVIHVDGTVVTVDSIVVVDEVYLDINVASTLTDNKFTVVGSDIVVNVEQPVQNVLRLDVDNVTIKTRHNMIVKDNSFWIPVNVISTIFPELSSRVYDDCVYLVDNSSYSDITLWYDGLVCARAQGITDSWSQLPLGSMATVDNNIPYVSLDTLVLGFGYSLLHTLNGVAVQRPGSSVGSSVVSSYVVDSGETLGRDDSEGITFPFDSSVVGEGYISESKAIAVLEAINSFRVSNGLYPIEMNQSLQQQVNVVSDTNINTPAKNLIFRHLMYGSLKHFELLPNTGEIMIQNARTYTPLTRLCELWYESPTHRVLMMNEQIKQAGVTVVYAKDGRVSVSVVFSFN
jgi:hypothetical protein